MHRSLRPKPRSSSAPILPASSQLVVPATRTVPPLSSLNSSPVHLSLTLFLSLPHPGACQELLCHLGFLLELQVLPRTRPLLAAAGPVAHPERAGPHPRAPQPPRSRAEPEEIELPAPRPPPSAGPHRSSPTGAPCRSRLRSGDMAEAPMHWPASSPPDLPRATPKRRSTATMASDPAVSRAPSPARVPASLPVTKNFESVRSVRIRSTTSHSSTSRIACFTDWFFFQAGSQKFPHRAIRYLHLRKKGILQVVLGEGYSQPAEYHVGVDGRLYLQKGWKEFVIHSGLKSCQVVVVNFFKIEDRMFAITFDVIG